MLDLIGGIISKCKNEISDAFRSYRIEEIINLHVLPKNFRERKVVTVERNNKFKSDDIEENYPIEIVEKIGKEFHEITERRMKEIGTEAVAFYVPFHFSDSWGIYFIEENLYGMSHSIFKNTNNLSFDDIFDLCYNSVLEHEIFHFRTELFSLIAEDMAKKAFYIPHFEKNKPYCKLEEALANAYAVPKSRKIKKEIKKLFDSSPPGYRDYWKYEKVTNRYNGVFELSNEILKRKIGTIWFPIDEFLTKKIINQIPIHHVLLPSIRDKDRIYFILANKRIADLISCIKRNYGPINIAPGGRHPSMEIKGKRIPFPVHGDEGIPPYLIKEIAKVLGIEKREIYRNCFGLSV